MCKHASSERDKYQDAVGPIMYLSLYNFRNLLNKSGTSSFSRKTLLLEVSRLVTL